MDEGGGKLDWITSGDRRALSRAYTRFVKAMRVVLPLLAVALTAVIILWREMDGAAVTATQEALMPELEQARGELLEPRFDSTDSSGRPYTITAQRAVQDANNPKVMLLDGPDAIVHMDDTTNLTGRAAHGVYEQEAGRLLLNGAVRFAQSGGYSLESAELRIDLTSGAAYSDLPVHVEGTMGRIDASGLEARNQDGVIIFKGPATLVLTQTDAMMSGGGS